jgi:lipid-binding SYLF domain-containing protein
VKIFSQKMERTRLLCRMGGSFGLQFGGQAVDRVMLIMNDDGMTELLSSSLR